MRAISVTRDGSPVASEAALENDEARFLFTPASQWLPGRRVVRVDGVIEDLTGNRLGKVFDVGTSEPTQRASATTLAETELDAPAR